MDKGLKTFSAAEAPWNTKAPAIPMVCIDEGSDDRPAIAGYPLPWRITEPTENGMQQIVDADGDSVIGAVEDDELYPDLVQHVNRVELLEDALVQAVAALGEAIGTPRDKHKDDWTLGDFHGMLLLLGLGDRLPRFMPEASS